MLKAIDCLLKHAYKVRLKVRLKLFLLAKVSELGSTFEFLQEQCCTANTGLNKGSTCEFIFNKGKRAAHNENMSDSEAMTEEPEFEQKKEEEDNYQLISWNFY
ncbi:hypothetical protein ACS0TY_013753 [Phlomoides rotata]